MRTTLYFTLKPIIVTPFYLPIYLLKPKRHPSQRTFLIQLLLNFIVATLIIVALPQINEIVFFKELRDRVIDSIMSWQSDFEPTTSTGHNLQRMAVFEIDNKTYREWGSPIITPRDKLKNLIERAKTGGANVIAIDINLTWLSDGCFHEPDRTPVCSPSSLNSDVALGLYLQKLNEEFHDPDNYDTPIILLKRTYRQPLDENGLVKTDTFLEKPDSFLQAYLKEEKNVFWTSSFFQVDDDSVRRRWQLAALVCEDNHLTVVPSMPLLAAMAQLHSCEDSTRKAAYMIRDFKRRLNDWAQKRPCDPSLGTTIPQICQNSTCPDLTVTVPSKIGVCDEVHTIDLAGGGETERVIYRFAPADHPLAHQRNLIDKYSALKVLNQETTTVDKQIVFIGVTHEDHPDHLIPIRHQEVSDVYLVANATDTLLRFGQFQPQSLIHKIGISIILVIILTLIFTHYKLTTAVLFSSLFIGFVLLVLGGLALHHGLWIDMTWSMLTIQIVQVILSFFETFWQIKSDIDASQTTIEK